MTPEAYGLTDVGRRRDANEDEFLVDAEVGVYAVADGMGGHAAGEIASGIAIRTLAETLRSVDWSSTRSDRAEVAERVRQAINEANLKICSSVEAREEWRGMGTTLVVLFAADDYAVIAHVGDSRAYLLRNGQLHRLTSDHSWVNEQVKLGLLSDEDAQRHPMRNIVTRALGNRRDVEVDLAEEPIRAGDTFLLCSDGLNTMLDDDEIREMLHTHEDHPRDACKALVDAANLRGGEDNTTVVILRVRG
jgi:protein phosphatase